MPSLPLVVLPCRIVQRARRRYPEATSFSPRSRPSEAAWVAGRDPRVGAFSQIPADLGCLADLGGGFYVCFARDTRDQHARYKTEECDLQAEGNRDHEVRVHGRDPAARENQVVSMS
ncbi:MAG: hypothetical protein WKF96_04615 [Solirubrobacteraceae bacterium]